MEGERSSYYSGYSSVRRRRRRRKSWGERIADWSRGLIAFLFSNVGIVCLVVGYTIAGAFLFIRIEARDQQVFAEDVAKCRNFTIATLWELASKENALSERIWKAKVRSILENYQKTMVTAIKNGYDGVEEVKKWSFAGAFLYSLTVITTIGYGNVCPKTDWGKIATIIYAIIGMPLFLLYLSNIGDILARSFKWTYARCCLCKCGGRPRRPSPMEMSVVRRETEARRNRWQMANVPSGEMETASLDRDDSSLREEVTGDENEDEDDEDDEDERSYDPQQVTVPLTLCLAIMVGYIWGGAVLFSRWEDWNMLDGSYFCFISLSTIGFGDIVPGDKVFAGQGLELSFIFCSMYLMLGMALIAMCFNLMQEEVIAKIRSLARIVKYIFRCDR